MTEQKFHKEEYEYFHTDKTFELATAERVQAFYNKKENQEIATEYSFVVSQGNGTQLIVLFGKERYDKLNRFSGEGNEYGDIWNVVQEKTFELENGVTAYVLDFKTEALLEQEYMDECDAHARAYFGIKEDDGKYSKYDVYSESELL